jgi:hypothetical protein
MVRRADEMVNTESNNMESNNKGGKGRANIPLDESRSPSQALSFRGQSSYLSSSSNLISHGIAIAR